jgi:signal transduction histidine kinase
MNLILNAIEAMPQGGKLTVKTYLYEKFKVAVEISDTGMGIPEEEISHIFEPFYTTKPEGTGLGLSIVHQIMEEHKATIEVKSTVGEGTAFKLVFRS